jgi:hypothetical protein
MLIAATQAHAVALNNVPLTAPEGASDEIAAQK